MLLVFVIMILYAVNATAIRHTVENEAARGLHAVNWPVVSGEDLNLHVSYRILHDVPSGANRISSPSAPNRLGKGLSYRILHDVPSGPNSISSPSPPGRLGKELNRHDRYRSLHEVPSGPNPISNPRPPGGPHP